MRNYEDGKPVDAAMHKTCFACHEPANARDFVFIQLRALSRPRDQYPKLRQQQISTDYHERGIRQLAWSGSQKTLYLVMRCRRRSGKLWLGQI